MKVGIWLIDFPIPESIFVEIKLGGSMQRRTGRFAPSTWVTRVTEQILRGSAGSAEFFEACLGVYITEL